MLRRTLSSLLERSSFCFPWHATGSYYHPLARPRLPHPPKETTMKRTITVFTAAIFATAIALPAFAQVGAGVAGNANVPDTGMNAGANSDIANSDAERAEPASPTDNSPTAIRRHMQRSENSTAI